MNHYLRRIGSVLCCGGAGFTLPVLLASTEPDSRRDPAVTAADSNPIQNSETTVAPPDRPFNGHVRSTTTPLSGKKAELWRKLLNDSERLHLLASKSELESLDPADLDTLIHFLTNTLGWNWDQLTASVPPAFKDRIEKLRLRMLKFEDSAAAWSFVLVPGNSARLGNREVMQTAARVALEHPDEFLAGLDKLPPAEWKASFTAALPALLQTKGLTEVVGLMWSDKAHWNNEELDSSVKSLISACLWQPGGPEDITQLLESLPEDENRGRWLKHLSEESSRAALSDPLGAGKESP